MQSPMITMNPALTPTDLTVESAVRGGYTAMHVMQSAAGFYVGTAYEEFDANGHCVWREPGTRDSIGYFSTREAAAAELRQMVGGDLSEARFEP